MRFKYHSILLVLLLTSACQVSDSQITTAEAGECDSSTDPRCKLGEWGDVEDWPIVPIHVNLLPTGLVIAWDRMDFSVNATHPHLYDPQTGGIFPTEDPGRDVFCAGHTLLADGRMFAAGGHIEDFWGLDMGHMFNPWTGRWYPLPSGERMNAGRWYPTNTLLPSGDVLVTSGLIDSPRHMNQLPQVFEVATNTWRDLTTATRLLPMYPRMHVVADGRVFYAGPGADTGYLDTSGTGSWTAFARTTTGLLRDYGSSVQYDEGKILIAGGGGTSGAPPTNTVELLDLNQAAPAWRPTQPMAFGRRHHNATLLPDGTILMTGGTSGEGDNNATGAIHEAELWDPQTETWTTLGRAQRPRLYHSIALLLPDGRVLTGASGHPSPDEADSEFNIEMFSPPYLFRGPRPEITQASDQASLGETITITTPNAADIIAVNLLRPGAVTHAQDQSQGINRLTFTATDDATLSVTLPENGNVLLRGYHMVFLINNAGVPSVASWIKIGDATVPPDGPPNETVDPNRPRAETVDYTFGFGGELEAKLVNLGPDERVATYIKVSEPRNRYYGQWLLDSEQAGEDTIGTIDENGIYRKKLLWEPNKDIIGSIVLVRFTGELADLPHETDHVDESMIVARCSPFHTEAGELATDIVEDHDDEHIHFRRARCTHRPAVRDLQYSWSNGGGVVAEVDDLHDDHGLAVYLKKDNRLMGQWSTTDVKGTIGHIASNVFAKPAPLMGPPAEVSELLVYRYEKDKMPLQTPGSLNQGDIVASCPLTAGAPNDDSCKLVDELILPTTASRVEFTWDDGGSLEADIPNLPDGERVAVYIKTDRFYGQWDPVNVDATIGSRQGDLYSKAPLRTPPTGAPSRLVLYRYNDANPPPVQAAHLDPFRVLASCQVWPVVESPCREIGVDLDLGPELKLVLDMRGLSGLIQSGANTDTSHLEVNALGIIAMADAGLLDEAQIILDSINRYQFPDGSYPNSFDSSASPPIPLQFRTRSPQDPPGEAFYQQRSAYFGPVNSGNNAYYLMALAAWSQAAQSDKYLDVMQRLADYIVTVAQKSDNTLDTFGGVVSQPTALPGSGHRHVYLAKHQAQAHAALHQLGAVLRLYDAPGQAAFYENRARLIRDFAFRELYDADNYFYTATHDDVDPNASPTQEERDFPSLDAQTLSILAFRNEDTPLTDTVEFAMQNFYGRRGIVNDNNILGATWFRGDQGVWLEGTAELGLVLALADDPRAQSVFDEMSVAEESTGGFQTFSEGYAVNTAIGEKPDRATNAQTANTFWRLYHRTQLNPFAITDELFPRVYEDAEDGTTNGWSISANQSGGASLGNVFDDERESVVIELTQGNAADPLLDAFVLRDEYEGDWDNTDQFVAEWSMNATTDFRVYFYVVTTGGGRIIYYSPAPNPSHHGNERFIHIALGNVADGSWRTFTRDLQEDLLTDWQNAGEQIRRVTRVAFRGSLRVDDIQLKSTSDANDSPPSVYEDAQDGTTNGWSISANQSGSAYVSNVLDDERQSAVIEITQGNPAAPLMDAFVLRNEDESAWNNTDQFVAEWSMNATTDFRVYFYLVTTGGPRVIYYSPAPNQSHHGNERFIHVALGNVANGSWRTFTRDLQADLLTDWQNTGERILRVTQMAVRGSLRVDDILLKSRL